VIHIPGHFAEHDLARLQALVRAHNFATLVSAHQGEIQVSHLPFLLDADSSTPHFYMARTTSRWRSGACPEGAQRPTTAVSQAS